MNWGWRPGAAMLIGFEILIQEVQMNVCRGREIILTVQFGLSLSDCRARSK
jgi:hypothetical protein